MTDNHGVAADAAGLSSATPTEPVPVSSVPVSIPNAARQLFLECCPVQNGELCRYGERAAVQAIASLLDRDRLIDLLSSELSDSYDCTRVWSAWGIGTMDEDDFVPVNDRVEELADGLIHALLASAIEARSDATGTGAAEGKSATAESRDAQPSPASTPTPESI